MPYYCALTASAFFLLAAPSTSLAELFERDWLTPGDGLLTFDPVNQREWLDFSDTRLDQFHGPMLEDPYHSLVNQFSPGGQFAESTVAKSDDMFALAQSGGVDVTTAGRGKVTGTDL